MAFPATPIDIFVEVALSADLTGSPSDWAWTDATDYVFAEPGITITRGGRDGVTQAPPSTCDLTVDNADGRWVPTNPTGAWYGQIKLNTPIRIRTNESSSSVRWTGFLSSLPPRWDPSENLRYLPVQASGVMQRLQRGSTPLQSALVRAITAMQVDAVNVSPVAYWPGEDGSEATEIAEYAGGAPMHLTGQVVTMADEGPAGSSPLPEFTTVSGVIANVPTRPATGEWSIAKVMNFPASPSAETIILQWFTSGTYPQWRITLTPGSPDTWALQAFDTAETLQINDAANFTITGVAGTEAIGLWVIVEANARQSGTSVIYSAAVHNGDGGTTVGGTEASITAGVITQVREHANAKLNGMHAGHWAVWDAVLDSVVDPYALDGYAGDRVRDRAVRLGNESGIGCETDSLPDITMGPQTQASLLTLWRECEAVGAGRLYENMDPTQFNALLRLKFAEDFENVDATLTLNHDSGHLAPDLLPTHDDQNLRNDWTATRSGASGTGSSARVVADSGNLTPAQVGTYDDSVSVNVETDEQLVHQAGWRVNEGTVEGLRFPTVTLNLARNPSLIATWIDCDIGSRITITDPPTGIAPDDVDLLIEGWTETLGPFTWNVQLNCSPYGPWHVFQLAETTGDTDPFLGRLAGDEKAALRSTLTSTATGANNFDPNFHKWTEAADDFPMDIRMAGEVMTLSGITSSAASFVAVGAASHADNAAVTPALYAGGAIRQLICVFAAIRSSGTGTLVTPTGYTRLPVFGATDNVQLFAKVHTGSESNPTVTPSGGAAGDTVSAFTFGWSGTPSSLGTASGTSLEDVVLDRIVQLNASAQNVSYGGLYAWKWTGNVHLILGWKQDDYTSIAVAAGFTEILEASTTTGNDQSLYAAYRIDTTPAVVNGGSLVVTGGASAISRSAVVALAGGIQVMTISARSVNGVVKAQSAGALIEVEDCAVLAL